LLIGLVDNQEIRIDAVRRVWEVEGVREVINEIQIGNRSSLKEYAQDLWITTQVRGLAAKTVGLRSVAYNFETIQGKVYIAGLTSRPEQLEAIIEVAKTVKGVNEIINYVIVKD
jgi:osmotically-inducible protein OsmY